VISKYSNFLHLRVFCFDTVAYGFFVLGGHVREKCGYTINLILLRVRPYLFSVYRTRGRAQAKEPHNKRKCIVVYVFHSTQKLFPEVKKPNTT
jgi:hypothetical protein